MAGLLAGCGTLGVGHGCNNVSGVSENEAVKLVNEPLTRTGLTGPATAAMTVRAIMFGQYAIAAVLAVVGVVLAVVIVAPILHHGTTSCANIVGPLVGANRTEDAEATRTLAQLEALAGESLTDVRRIVAALAPAELENDALAAALQRMLERASADSGIAFELHADELLPQLPTDVEVGLLRTA